MEPYELAARTFGLEKNLDRVIAWESWPHAMSSLASDVMSLEKENMYLKERVEQLTRQLFQAPERDLED